MSAIDTTSGNLQTLLFDDDGATPNNRFPVLLYRFQLDPAEDNASAFEALFSAHQWAPLWRAGIFDYHHFHPNAHEALGVARGHAQVTLGGEAGQTLSVKVGDVLVLPAGTGHRCVEASDDFLVVGAYPHGQEQYDIQRPDRATHQQALARIAAVPVPAQDPATGMQMTHWHNRTSNAE
ncbi:cupin domain-containing protein [Pseudomonas vlassakiae]|uniref:cupin domain-containing protein n=1 Tax=Pseudomonas vlassakiae TaxID=485888 RepID=UPI0021CAB59F|nr:cupin domain-containing protein [Pseudomonas vlassakiae]MCU0122981.1 cupin domain-containing protein [Pseudomonas vlassakiae]